MNVLIYFFTSFARISILRWWGNCESSQKKKKKNVKIVAVCVALLGYNLFIRGQGIKEAAVPNIPSTVKLLIGTISVKRKKFHQTHGNS